MFWDRHAEKLAVAITAVDLAVEARRKLQAATGKAQNLHAEIAPNPSFGVAAVRTISCAWPPRGGSCG